jgi:hypothetical protein
MGATDMNRWEHGYYFPWVIEAGKSRSRRFNARWLEQATVAQSYLNAARNYPDLRSAFEQYPVLARCNLNYLASEVIDDVISEGHYRPMLKSPEVEPFALLKLLKFFKGEGPEIVLRMPSDLSAEILRSATKRVPRMVREIQAYVASQKTIQL